MPPTLKPLIYLDVSYESYSHTFFKLIHRSVEIKYLYNLLRTKQHYRESEESRIQITSNILSWYDQNKIPLTLLRSRSSTRTILMFLCLLDGVWSIYRPAQITFCGNICKLGIKLIKGFIRGLQAAGTWWREWPARLMSPLQQFRSPTTACHHVQDGEKIPKNHQRSVHTSGFSLLRHYQLKTTQSSGKEHEFRSSWNRVSKFTVRSSLEGPFSTPNPSNLQA